MLFFPRLFVRLTNLMNLDRKTTSGACDSYAVLYLWGKSSNWNELELVLPWSPTEGVDQGCAAQLANLVGLHCWSLENTDFLPVQFSHASCFPPPPPPSLRYRPVIWFFNQVYWLWSISRFLIFPSLDFSVLVFLSLLWSRALLKSLWTIDIFRHQEIFHIYLWQYIRTYNLLFLLCSALSGVASG